MHGMYAEKKFVFYLDTKHKPL